MKRFPEGGQGKASAGWVHPFGGFCIWRRTILIWGCWYKLFAPHFALSATGTSDGVASCLKMHQYLFLHILICTLFLSGNQIKLHL